jgi:predicted PurR-regulated permease PerM
MENKLENTKIVYYARIGLVLHAFVLVMLILHLGKFLFIPLFFALLVALLLYPLAKFLERYIKRSFSAIISVLLFLIFVGSIIFFFTKELVLFLRDLPKAQSKFFGIVQNIQHWISFKYNIDDTQQMDYLKKSTNNVSNNLVSSIGNTFVGTIEFVVVFIFFLIFTYFILDHRRLLRNFLLAFFNKQQQAKITTIIESTRTVINSYVLGLLTEMATIFALILIVMLVLGVKYALLIAVIAAVLNIIPYLGIYIAAAFGMLIALTNGTGNMAIEVGVTFIIVHFVDANILMPHIVGGRVRINPFITIVAVIMGRLIWGIPGMFLFIPLTAIFRIISENVTDLKPWSILIGEEK